MSDEEKPRRRGFVRRWARRLTVGFLALLLVLTLVVWGGRIYLGKLGTERLHAVATRLDADEPGWRMDAITARRQKDAPPPERNAAAVVLRVAGRVPPEHEKEWNKLLASEEWSGRVQDNHRLPPELLAELRRVAPLTGEARSDALTLRDLPAGQYPLVMKDNPLLTLMPHLEKVRHVAALLQSDALLAAAENDPDAAIRDAHAALNAGRSVGDEPLLVSQVVRIACGTIAAQSAVQTLAWGEPKAGLAELQAALAAEADEPWFLNGLRGERAMLDRFFANLEAGTLGPDDLAAVGMQTSGPVHRSAFRLYKAVLPEDHAAALRVLNDYAAAARLPHHEQSAALARVQLPPRPPDDFRYAVTNLLVPGCEKVGEAALRARAVHLAASCLIACERFRQKVGRWPASLAEIPTDILPAVPTDPYDGHPLRFERLPDGVTVYSVGPAKDHRSPKPSELGPYTAHGIGWKLWDPEERGFPPRPRGSEAEDEFLRQLLNPRGHIGPLLRIGPPGSEHVTPTRADAIPPPREVKR